MGSGLQVDLVHHYPEPLRLEIRRGKAPPTVILRVGPVTEIPPSFVPQPSSVQVQAKKGSHMGVIITDLQKCPITVGGLADAEGNPPTDGQGNPITITGVSFGSSDPSVLDVSADPNDPSGMGGVAARVGPEGTAQAQVQVTCSDGTSLTGTLDFQVVGSVPTAVQITAGAPEPA